MSTSTDKEREKMSESDFGDPTNRKFPIMDQSDVDAAAHLIGKADDPAAVKKRIIAIAKRKGLTIPDAWNEKEKSATLSRRSFLLDTDIKSTNILPDGTLVLTGYASSFQRDRDRETFHPDGFAKALPGYLRNPVLLLEHDPKRIIGRVDKAIMDTSGVFIEAHVFPPPEGTEPWHVKAYNDIKNGLFRGFSVGGLFDRVKNSIVGLDWCETSVVSIPANPSALFDVAQKSFELPTNWTERFGESTATTAAMPLSTATLDGVTRATAALRDVLAKH